MPLDNINQPEMIRLSDMLRLKKYDGHFEQALPGYQDPFVYQNSEGIFDDAKKPNSEYVERMCRYLNKVGELYYIEAKEPGKFIPIGDVTVKPENPPIAIWRDDYRVRGIGFAVMTAVVDRLRALGFDRITGSTVYVWYIASQRLHEKLGFQELSRDEKEITYELLL